MSILIPAIKTSLFDAIPEIRASAAKALGRLSKALAPTNSSKCWVGSVSTWIKRIARALRNQELLKATLR